MIRTAQRVTLQWQRGPVFDREPRDNRAAHCLRFFCGELRSITVKDLQCVLKVADVVDVGRGRDWVGHFEAGLISQQSCDTG